MSRHIFRCWIFIAVVAFAGCGDNTDNKPDEAGEPDASTESCVPDPDLIAQESACVRDDHCPCGTHCDLGRCTAECTADEDCSLGESCDEFGRCRAFEDTAMVPLPDEQGQGDVAVDRSRLFLDVSTEENIEITVEAQPITRARVAAERGVEVKCPGQDEFVVNCMLADLQVDDTVAVGVRYASSYDPESDDIPTVTVYGPSNTETVMVPRFEQAGIEETLPPEQLSGSYTGVIRLEEVGTDAALDALSEAPIPTQFTVEATVWELDGGVLMAIDDPHGALTSDEQFIGVVELDDADDADDMVDGTASFEDHPFAEAIVAGREHRILASTVDAQIRSRLNPRTLNIALTQTYVGLGTAVAPAVRWSVELERAGGARGSLPTRTHLPATLGYDPAERLAANPPWLDAFTGNGAVDIDGLDGELISCIASDSIDEQDYMGWEFGESLTPRSKDMECANSAMAGGIALDLDDTELSASDVLTTCVSELDALDQPPPAWAAPNDLFDADSECIDVGRFLAAVGAQASAFGDPDASWSADQEQRAATYTQRLLVRWLDLHGFIASETDQAEQMAEYFRQGYNQTESDVVPATLEANLSASAAGWDLFLTPHVANAVFEMPVEALEAPDYRLHHTGQPGAGGGDPAKALAPVIFEALNRHGKLIERYVRAEGATRGAEADYMAQWLPRMLVTQAMAVDMKQRVDAAGSAPGWLESYDNHLRGARAGVLDAVEYVTLVNEGGNPLGIEDIDLPMYHIADDNDGQTERFSAITDYIAGRLDDDSGWAREAIERAENSLASAEDLYVAAADREWRNGLVDAVTELSDQWKKDLKRQYNTQLFDMCGPNLGAGDADYSPVDDPDFNAANCAVADTPECQIGLEELFEPWTDNDVMGRLCMQYEKNRKHSLAPGLDDPAMRDFIDQCYARRGLLPTEGSLVSFGPCVRSDGYCLNCDWRERNAGEGYVGEVELSPMSFEIATSHPSSHPDRRAAVERITAEVRQTCQRRHPGMRIRVPQKRSPLETPDCLTGSIGESLLDVVAATNDIATARKAYSDHLKAYDIATSSCWVQKRTNQRLQNARERHTRSMQNLRSQKMKYDRLAEIAGGVKDCMSALTGASGVGLVAGGGACAAASMETGFTLESMNIERDMTNAQENHDNHVATIAENGEERRCFIEAKQELVGMETAASNIKAAVFALERAQADVEGQLMEAQRIYDRGNANIEELSEDTPDADGDQWAQNDINQYVRDFALARRATYLAVRAIEYEYQQSLGARQDVLDAKLPQTLSNVLTDLQTVAGTRSIDGSAANELTAVVSLRDDILRLNDNSHLPEQMHRLSVEERFRTLLTSKKYAVYDDSGAYIGQRVPFELAPLGAMDVDTGGVGIYSRNDCAERLWSVDAGIVGDEAAVGGSKTVRLDIAQRNTFYSQWCGDRGSADSRFQYASVRPSRNLFRVPGMGKLEGTEEASDAVEEFSIARVQAAVGTDEPTLETEQDSSGASAELATRGLYGDYAIFIDAENISRAGEDGVDLDKVDDILLRFDYLSVAR